MSATSIAVPATRPAGSAPPLAASFPMDLSHSPLLGILGVILGAGIVTLAGRLLTLGLADLKGSIGIGFDEGAWISTVFNAALIFIGPFSVYLGGLLGPRRVLLTCAATFALRNIPLRYLGLVVALYVTFIEGAVNFAPSLYGLFREHISWEWMFWIP